MIIPGKYHRRFSDEKTLSFLNDNRLNILGVFILACPQTLLSKICHVTTRITTFAYKMKNFGNAKKKNFSVVVAMLNV